MKRNIVAAAAVVVVLGVVIVGGAAVTGAQAKQKLQAVPAEWQSQWPMLKVSAQKYDRGLFSATNTITLQFGCGAPNDAGITIRQTIKHGPLPGFSTLAAAVIDTEVVVPESERKQVAALIGDKSPFTAHTVVGFGGSRDTTFSIPAMNYDSPKGDKVRWQGLAGDVHESGGKLRYDVATPGFSVWGKDDKAAFDMKLESLRMHGELAAGEGSFWLRPGGGEIELVGLDVNAIAQTGSNMPPLKMSLKQVKASAQNTIEKDLLSNVGKFSASGTVNDVRVDKVEMQASLKRIHAPTYQRFVQRFIDTGNAACGMKQAVSPQVMLAQVQQDIAALLPFNPEYAIDKLAVEIDGKRGELSYSVGVAGATADDAQLPMQALLMTRGQLRGEAKLPAVWVEKMLGRFGAGAQAPQGDAAAQAEMANVMITKFTNDGYIVKDGDMLRAQVSFDKGQMLVNGKPIGQPAPQ